MIKAMRIGKDVSAAREAAGMTMAALARLLGVTRQFIWDVESDRRPFPPSQLEKLPPEMRDSIKGAMIDAHMAEVDRLMDS
jgi:transcriptional regulator with XRE-family HTH domain